MTQQHASDPLTQEQVQFFNDNGYLVIENFVALEEAQKLRQQIQHIIETQYDAQKHKSIFMCDHTDGGHIKDQYFLDSSDQISFFLETTEQQAQVSSQKQEEQQENQQEQETVPAPQAQQAQQRPKDAKLFMNKIGHALADRDPIFQQFTFRDYVYRATKQLMQYEDPMVVQSMYIFKPPFIGGPVTPHRDGTFVLTHQKPCVGWWFPLEDATLENGCLWGAPGTHRDGLVKRWVRTCRDNSKNEMRFEPVIRDEKDAEAFVDREDKADYVPVEMKAGSVIVLHGHFLHKSNGNESSKGREAYTFHLADRNDYDREKNWLLRDEFPDLWPHRKE